MQPDDSSINQRHEKGIKIFDTLGIDCKKAKFKNHSRQLPTGDPARKKFTKSHTHQIKLHANLEFRNDHVFHQFFIIQLVVLVRCQSDQIEL